MGFKVYGMMKDFQVVSGRVALEGLKLEAAKHGADLVKDVAGKGFDFNADLSDDKVLYFRAKMLGYDLPNGNGDAIPRIYAADFGPSFIGKHLDLNHETDVANIIGKVVSTFHVEAALPGEPGAERIIGLNALADDDSDATRELQLEGISRIDRNTDLGELVAQKLLAGTIDGVSQEASTDYALCSCCKHKVGSPMDALCAHLENGSLMIQSYQVEGRKHKVLAYKEHHNPVGTGLAVVPVPAYDRGRVQQMQEDVKAGKLDMTAAILDLKVNALLNKKPAHLMAAIAAMEATGTKAALDSALNKLNGHETLAMLEKFGVAGADAAETAGYAAIHFQRAKDIADKASMVLPEEAEKAKELLNKAKDRAEQGIKTADQAAMQAGLVKERLMTVLAKWGARRGFSAEVALLAYEKSAKVKASVDKLMAADFADVAVRQVSLGEDAVDNARAEAAKAKAELREEGLGEGAAEAAGAAAREARRAGDLFHSAEELAEAVLQGTLFRKPNPVDSYWVLSAADGRVLTRVTLGALSGGQLSRPLIVAGKKMDLGDHLTSTWAMDLADQAAERGVPAVIAELEAAQHAWDKRTAVKAGVDDAELETLREAYLAARDAREANSGDPGAEKAYLAAQSAYRAAKAESEKAFFEEFNKTSRDAREAFDKTSPIGDASLPLPVDGARKPYVGRRALLAAGLGRKFTDLPIRAASGDANEGQAGEEYPDELFRGDVVEINYAGSKRDGSEPYQGPATVTGKEQARYSDDIEYTFQVGDDDDCMFDLGHVVKLLTPSPKRAGQKSMKVPDLDGAKCNPDDGPAEVDKLGLSDVQPVDDYSGRFMYGEVSPFAFTCRNPSDQQDKKLTEWGLRRDSLGHKTIYYLEALPAKNAQGVRSGLRSSSSGSRSLDIPKTRDPSIHPQPANGGGTGL